MNSGVVIRSLSANSASSRDWLVPGVRPAAHSTLLCNCLPRCLEKVYYAYHFVGFAVLPAPLSRHSLSPPVQLYLYPPKALLSSHLTSFLFREQPKNSCFQVVFFLICKLFCPRFLCIASHYRAHEHFIQTYSSHLKQAPNPVKS